MIDINTTVPISGFTVNKNPDGTVSIFVSYSGNIQGQPMKITVDPAKTSLPIFSRTSASVSNLAIIPSDNEGAYYYDENVYKMQGILEKVGLVVAVMSLLFFFIGIISGKMIGI